MQVAAYPERFVPFGLTGKDEVLLGVELELRHAEGYSLPAMQKVKNSLLPDEELFMAAAIYDGSVVGVEFVTHPANIRMHQQYWPKLMPKLRDAGFFAESGVGGLHVHVSRKSWFPGQLQLLIALTLFGGGAWKDFQREVMGRESDRWAASPDVRLAAPGNIGQSLHLAREYIEQTLSVEQEQGTRYRKVNLMPRDTVEFRQGHSTADVSKVLLRVEFVHALIQFCREANRYGKLEKVFPAGLPSPKAFLAWVRRQGTWSALTDIEL